MQKSAQNWIIMAENYRQLCSSLIHLDWRKNFNLEKKIDLC